MAHDSLLQFTPPERMTDAQGRPYFLWDSQMTLTEFQAALADPDPQVSTYYLGKLMRQARPDDVFQFVSLGRIRRDWDACQRYLGNTRPMWAFLIRLWSRDAA